jgi:hypothetical protein
MQDANDATFLTLRLFNHVKHGSVVTLKSLQYRKRVKRNLTTQYNPFDYNGETLLRVLQEPYGDQWTCR